MLLQSPCLHPLEDVDLLHLILLQSEIDFDYDTKRPIPERAAIRLLNSAASRLTDSLCTSYRDTRRSGDAMLTIDPNDVATRAAAAMQTLGPLQRIQLEGLDDDALATVLAAAGRTAHDRKLTGSSAGGMGLENLWLQRGQFSGSCLYTCDPRLAAALPERSPLVDDVGCGPPSPSRSPKLLPRLLELDLGGCGQLTDAGLEALTAEAPLLAQLRITVNSRLSKPRLSCPWLRSATIAICTNLDDEAVDALCAGAPLLRELSLWRCSSLRTPAIEARNLRTLNLCECAELTDGAIMHVAKNGAHLSSLYLAGCDALGGSTPHWGGGASLTTLDVSDLPSITDAQLTAACVASPELTRLDCSRSGPSVQVPVIGGPKLGALLCTKCEHLVDESVSGACDRSPVLVSLMLALCTSLFSPRIHGEAITELNMSGCRLLQDAAVTHACKHCPRLAKLSLSLCAALLEPIIVGASLRRVELSRAEGLSRPIIGGPLLEELALSGCPLLEDASLEGAMRHCPRLRRLMISGCTALEHACIVGPSLRILECHNVARAVVDGAADRMHCPQLASLACDVYGDGDGFAEVE